MSTRAGSAAFAALVGLAVGCCGQDGDGGSKSIAATDFPTAMVDALCASAANCRLVADQASCREGFDSGTISDLFAAVDAGTILYHGDLAAQCLDALRRAYDGCSRRHFAEIESEAGDPCTGAFEGTVAIGGDCLLDEECQSDDCAFGADCTDSCCQGVCLASAVIPLGGDCSGAMQMCAEGSFCDLGALLCRAQVGAGEACQDLSACQPGLACVGSTLGGAPGTCTVLAGEGEACDPLAFLGCDRFDDFCDRATHTCVKSHRVGDPCEPDTEGACVTFAYCDAGTCTASPDIGQACDLVAGPYCAGPLDCVSGTCAKHDTDACPR